MELPVPVIAGIVDPIMNVMFDLIMIMIAMSMNEMLKMRMIGIDYVSYECGRVMRLNMMILMLCSMMILLMCSGTTWLRMMTTRGYLTFPPRTPSLIPLREIASKYIMLHSVRYFFT